MAKGKNILTTGDVAKICHVAARTVSKWFDNGQLKGYRIPGSKDRRIPLSELIRFMKAHNMPTMGLEAGKIRILIVDSDEMAASTLAEELKTRKDYTVEVVCSDFETGAVAQKFSPHVLIINIFARNISAADICTNIRKSADLQTIKVIALANNLSPAEATALLEKGFDDISDPCDIEEIVHRIEEATAIIY